MKANELIMCDWVMLDGIPKRLTLWDIVRISRGVYTAEPMPLTEEILNANGIDIFSHCDLSVPKYYMGINVEERRVCIKMQFKYVHELQHALILCGLNDLADNFKVPV